MPTEEGIAPLRMRREGCASLRNLPIPSSVSSAATFSLWEKGNIAA